MDYTFRAELQRLSYERDFEALFNYYTEKYDENPDEYTKWDYKRYLVLGAIKCERFLQFNQSKCKYYRFAHSIIYYNLNKKDKSYLTMLYEDLGKVDFEFGVNKAKNKNFWLNRAIYNYKKALDNGNKNVEIYYEIACAYQELSINEEAVVWYDKAIEKDDSYYNAYTSKANLLYDMGEYDKSIQTWHDLKNRFNEENFYWVGANLEAKGEYEEAIKTYKKGIEYSLIDQDYDYADELTKYIAYVYEKMKNYTKVLETHLSRTKIQFITGVQKGRIYTEKSRLVHIYRDIAEFYERINDKENAIEYWHKLIKCKGKNFSRHLACKNLAWYYFNNKDLKHALYYSNKGIKLYWEWFYDYPRYKSMKEASKSYKDIVNDLVDLLLCHANTLFDLKKINAFMNEYKNALKYIKYMDESTYKDWIKETIINVKLHIGVGYIMLNELKQAEKYLRKTNHPYYYLCKAELAYRNKKMKSVKKYYTKFEQVINEPPQFDEDEYEVFTFLKQK